jgi:hypothetical protein
MRSREQVCSQQVHCLSCPLSVRVTGKDCRELSLQEIRKIMKDGGVDGGYEFYLGEYPYDARQFLE